MILKNGKRIDGCTDTLPVGTVQPFLGLTPPLGYLVCQGQLISKVEYPELYQICGSIFGTETDTHFYLPDLRGKTITGYNPDNELVNTIGKLLGAESHVHTTGNHTLIESEMPMHTHSLPSSDQYGKNYTPSNEYIVDSRSLLRIGRDNLVSMGKSLTESAGSSQPHNHGDTGEASNYQPTIVLNWIVKAAMLIPEYFIVENTLTSTSTSNALSAAQGKILNEKIENYSSFRTVETIVGYADNNVPVYRKLIEITTPSEVGVDTVVGTLPADQKGLYTMQGIVLNSASCGVPFNYYFNAENWGSIWFDYNTKEIWCVVNNRAYVNRQGHIIIEYSKH